MFKKLMIALAMVAMVAVNAGATDYYYYSDPAVQGGYSQGAIPFQGAAVNGAVAYGDLAASADLVVVQALPMTQSMHGLGMGGATTSSFSKSEETSLRFDRISLQESGNPAHIDYYYGYGWHQTTIYNPYWSYYYYYYPIYNSNGYGEYDINFDWTSISYNKYSGTSMSLTVPLPAVLEMKAAQGFENSFSFESAGMKLEMGQKGFQAGSMKVTGYGNSGTPIVW